MGFIVSPFLSPFAFGFLVARARQVLGVDLSERMLTVFCSWRWTYGIGSIYGAVVVGLIVLFSEET